MDIFGGMECPRQSPAHPSELPQIVVCGKNPGVWPDILARAEAAVGQTQDRWRRAARTPIL